MITEWKPNDLGELELPLDQEFDGALIEQPGKVFKMETGRDIGCDGCALSNLTSLLDDYVVGCRHVGCTSRKDEQMPIVVEVVNGL